MAGGDLPVPCQLSGHLGGTPAMPPRAHPPTFHPQPPDLSFPAPPARSEQEPLPVPACVACSQDATGAACPARPSAASPPLPGKMPALLHHPQCHRSHPGHSTAGARSWAGRDGGGRGGKGGRRRRRRQRGQPSASCPGTSPCPCPPTGIGAALQLEWVISPLAETKDALPRGCPEELRGLQRWTGGMGHQARLCHSGAGQRGPRDGNVATDSNSTTLR